MPSLPTYPKKKLKSFNNPKKKEKLQQMPQHRAPTPSPHAKRILVVCDQGLNRSQTIKGQIQYWGHDVLTVGLKRNTPATIASLAEWAELIILTAKDQQSTFQSILDWWHGGFNPRLMFKIQLWDIGPDNYPRPYNKELLDIVKTHIKQHEDELKPPKVT
jgi:galactitol-specific phosphotransferase system IIB component